MFVSGCLPSWPFEIYCSVIDYMLFVTVDVTCPILQTPHNAVIDGGNCDGVADIGDTCRHKCISGTTQASGEREHRCGTDLKWTGNPIVCYGWLYRQGRLSDLPTVPLLPAFLLDVPVNHGNIQLFCKDGEKNCTEVICEI